MPQIIHGRIDLYTTQPDYEITESDDGTLEGTVDYECDRSNSGSLPLIGSPHPLFPSCELYARKIKVIKNNKVRMTGSYFGLLTKETKPVITTSPGVDRVAIEAHPDFAAFAGTGASPLNGANFDAETGEFLGFFDPDTAEFFGVRHYFSSSDTVTESYWTRSQPKAIKLMQIVSEVPGHRKPSNVKNLLLVTAPIRQVGSHYQVSKNYLTSGPNGWSTTIYP